MTITVTLVRHAQSTHNAFGDMNRDVPVTPEGAVMSKKIVGDYDIAICSILKRARQTLEYSNITCKEVIYTDLCREIRDGNPINLLAIENMSVAHETSSQIAQRIKELKNLIRRLSPASSSNSRSKTNSRSGIKSGIKSGINQCSPRIIIFCHASIIREITGNNVSNCQQINYSFD